MNAERTLRLILAAQSRLDLAERVVVANERLLGKRLVTWPMFVGSIKERDAAREAVAATLRAALAHREVWCHDSSTCPICITEREESHHVIDDL